MKKIWGVVAIILFLLGIGTVLFWDQPIGNQEQAVAANIPAVDLAFAVLGDIHGNTASFQVALRDLHAINPGTQALILNGDTVDQGLTEQYNSIKKTLVKNKAFLPPDIIKNIGNHEFFDYEVEVNSPAEVKTFINRYLEFAEEEKVYHDTWLKGYHFISLGSEDGNSETLDSIRAYISVDQQNWLKERLTEKYEKGKPIFVFLHQHLNTDSSKGWVGTDQGREITDILSQYPEVILFTSHTHRPLDETSVNTDPPFTMVHTGAVHYTIVPDSQGGRTRESLINGLYVEVKDNQITVRGRDSKNHAWIFEKEISEDNTLFNNTPK